MLSSNLGIMNTLPKYCASTYYWSEQPYSFAFLVLFGIVMVPLVGAFAYQCLRLAVTGHMKPTA